LLLKGGGRVVATAIPFLQDLVASLAAAVHGAHQDAVDCTPAAALRKVFVTN
jgi:hypothetical protein